MLLGQAHIRVVRVQTNFVICPDLLETQLSKLVMILNFNGAYLDLFERTVMVEALIVLSGEWSVNEEAVFRSI